MGPWLTGLLVGIGAGVWTWNKMMKETNRQDSSLILGAVVGVLAFFVLGTMLKFLLHF